MIKKSYSYSRIKTIIIDSDTSNVSALRGIIEECFFEEINLLATFEHPQVALDWMSEVSIDLIFMEVDYPDMDGFEFIRSIPDDLKAKVVLVCSSDKHAMKAFKHDVFDYLVKPIDYHDFTDCIKRYEKYRRMPSVMVEDFMRNDLLIINRQDKAVFVGVKEIVRLEANGSYTEIYLENGTRYNSTKNIMYYEERLSKQRFYKVHRSHLINLAKVKELLKYDGDGIIIMQDNSKIEISRTKKNEFLRALTK